jgi:hypothetical protein
MYPFSIISCGILTIITAAIIRIIYFMFSNTKKNLIEKEIVNSSPTSYPNSDNSEQIYTKNMFVESHYELGLSLFDKYISDDKINNAYEKLLDEYVNYIKKGLPPPFDINEKKEARDYLLNFKM